MRLRAREIWVLGEAAGRPRIGIELRTAVVVRRGGGRLATIPAEHTVADIKISVDIDISIAVSTPPPTILQEAETWPAWCDPGHPLGVLLIGLAAIEAAGILHLG